jgi:hypothetical protein
MLNSCTTSTKVMNTWSFAPALPIRLHGTLLSNNKLFHAISEHIGTGTIARAIRLRCIRTRRFSSTHAKARKCMEVTGQLHAGTADRHTTEFCTDQNRTAIPGGQSSSLVTVLTDISRLPEKWLWLISVLLFHSNVSNGNMAHRCNCPQARTAVHCWPPLATRRTSA